MSPFTIPKEAPAGVDWGYRKRTGIRGSYRYWYEDTITEKLYEGKRPSDYRIRNGAQAKRHPASNQIVANPWKNYNETNPELIETTQGALMNYFGITDLDELHLHEDQGLSQTVTDVMNYIHMDQRLDVQLIRKIHNSIFWRIYPWAGRYRTVEVMKPGFRWGRSQYIPQGMERYETDVLNDLTPARFQDDRIFDDAAILVGDLLAIHPFREGNGRVAKIVAGVVLLQANYPLPNLTRITKGDLVKAALDSYGRNYQPLRDLLRSSIPS